MPTLFGSIVRLFPVGQPAFDFGPRPSLFGQSFRLFYVLIRRARSFKRQCSTAITMANRRKILRFARSESRCNRTIVNSLRSPAVTLSYIRDSRVICASDYKGNVVAHGLSYSGAVSEF